jgi:glyoxylase-like metal-dependent hydrolase (beta-lactamase superfamily II)
MTQAMVTPIRLSLSNAYLVQGARPMLIDTGAPNEVGKILAALAAKGLTPADLSLVLHTHVHSDHVGSSAALLEAGGVPAAIHPADRWILTQGHSGMLRGIGLRGQIMARFMNNRRFPPFAADVELSHGMRLDRFGVAGAVLHTPGHTAGSVSILLDSGEAIVGDLLMGGYLGGTVRARHPMYHYFAEQFELLGPSLAQVLGQHPHTLYVGHGGPLAAYAVRARWRHLAPVAMAGGGTAKG